MRVRVPPGALMAEVHIRMWHGTRHRCSECGTYGYPRTCSCSGSPRALEAPHPRGAYVQDWHEWLVYLDIFTDSPWPARRLELVVDAERSFSDEERM